VYSLAVQADGKVLVGGYFGALSNQTRTCIGHLSNNDSATQVLGSDGSSVVWLRGGGSPEVWATTFDLSTSNGTTWTSLGAGTRITGGWQLTGISAPTNSLLRARGFLSGGYQNGSSGYVETIVHVVPPPVIVVNDGNFGLRTNHFGFDVTGGPGDLVVEGSTNLSTWVALATNKISAAPFYFSDSTPATLARRFYRARWQ
jgi:hypothetical protein